MRCIGLDVHKRMTAVCILGEDGKKEKAFVVRGDWIKLMVVQSLRRLFQVCYEASSGYGFLYDGLSRMADKVCVADSGQLRLIFRSKPRNDRVDAEKLAKLLFLDEVPPVYVQRMNIRDWREMITYRSAMANNQTSSQYGGGRGLNDGSCVLLRPCRRNHVWFYDFL